MNILNYTYTFVNSLVADFKMISNIFNGEAIAAHVHGPAGRGGVAPVIFPGTLLADGVVGSVIPIGLNDLRSYNKELTYSNIHTTLYPGGSIRGQNLPLYFIQDGAPLFNFAVSAGTTSGDFSLLTSLEAQGSRTSNSAVTLNPSTSTGNSTTTFQMTFTSTNAVPKNFFGITGRLLRGVVVTMNMKGTPGSQWDISLKNIGTRKGKYDVVFQYTGTYNYFTGFFFIPVETIPSFTKINSKEWTFNFAISSQGSNTLSLDYVAVNIVVPNPKTGNELGPLMKRLYNDLIPAGLKRRTNRSLKKSNRNNRSKTRAQRRRRKARRNL